MAHQRGFCDPGCDIGDCDCLGSCVGDVCSGGNCGWPWERKTMKKTANLDDYLNNEKALKERIREAQDRAKNALQDER